jgi:hypothetical protein
MAMPYAINKRLRRRLYLILAISVQQPFGKQRKGLPYR